MIGSDHTIVEMASWRLASEFVRRHPDETRLFRGHPGGGQSDVLWIIDPAAVGTPDGGLDVRLNRNGRS